MRVDDTVSPFSATAPTVSARNPCEGAACGERVNGAALGVTEGEVLAGHHAADAQVALQAVGDKLLGGQRGEIAVEVEHHHRIGAGVGEQPLALVQRGEAERRGRRAEMADRMRIERRDQCGATLGLGPCDRARDHGLVTEVKSIEIAQRYDPVREMRRNGRAAVEPLHGGGL
ncbi:hypothetical protein QFZ54_003418 [Sphingomonas faeni]|nr:hypothetical protein [Sphingomonas faeni]